FQDGGWFGGNIKAVRVALRCAEGKARLVCGTPENSSSGTSPNGLPPGYYPCPHCGFISIRDGMKCPGCRSRFGTHTPTSVSAGSGSPSAARCPKCGFAYKWNGRRCGHCHHSA